MHKRLVFYISDARISGDESSKEEQEQLLARMPLSKLLHRRNKTDSIGIAKATSRRFIDHVR